MAGLRVSALRTFLPSANHVAAMNQVILLEPCMIVIRLVANPGRVVRYPLHRVMRAAGIS